MGHPSDPSHDVTGSAVRGVFWVGGGQVIRQVVGILTYIILARLLVPDDFGLLSMVMVFVGFSRIFADFGIGSAIVQSKEVTQIKLSSAFWTNLAVSIVIALIVIAISPWIADFYNKPELVYLVITISSTLVLAGMVTIPKAILYRSMNFGAAVKAEVIGSLLAAICVVFLAFMGFGVWSLVLQPIIGNLFVVIFTFYFSSWLPSFVYSWKSIKKLVHFSANILGSDVVTYLTRNSDDLIIGKTLGSAPLGQYTLAYQIMLYPLQQVASIIVKVLFPTLSKFLDDLERFRNIYLKAVVSIALITFPMMFGLLAITTDFITVVFGEKWLPMKSVLEIFCLMGMFQSVGTTLGTIYMSTGQVKKVFYLGIFFAPLYIIAFLIGTKWGIVGVAWGFSIVVFTNTITTMFVGFRIINLSVGRFFRVLSSPLLISLAMYLSILGLNKMLGSLDEISRLIVDVSFGALIYVVLSLMFNKTQIQDLYGRLTSVFAK